MDRSVFGEQKFAGGRPGGGARGPEPGARGQGPGGSMWLNVGAVCTQHHGHEGENKDSQKCTSGEFRKNSCPFNATRRNCQVVQVNGLL